MACPDPFRVGIDELRIDALSGLDSERVTGGREGPNTPPLRSTSNPVTTLTGSKHRG